MRKFYVLVHPKVSTPIERADLETLARAAKFLLGANQLRKAYVVEVVVHDECPRVKGKFVPKVWIEEHHLEMSNTRTASLNNRVFLLPRKTGRRHPTPNRKYGQKNARRNRARIPMLDHKAYTGALANVKVVRGVPQKKQGKKKQK